MRLYPFINSFPKKGDTVFDPFCGSGMTGVAALLTNRNALLPDISTAAVSHREKLHYSLRYQEI